MKLADAERFLRSLYLGDRACLAYCFDEERSEFRLNIDEISRIRDQSGDWNNYNEENIENGCLVFAEVRSVRIEPKGVSPNDFVEIDGVREIPEGLLFCLTLGSVGQDGLTTEIRLEIVAGDTYMEDPSQPCLQIR